LEKIVKTLKSYFFFSLTAILKASKSPNSSALKSSLEWPKAMHLESAFKVLTNCYKDIDGLILALKLILDF
jgi:hypothetical protein